MLAARPSNNTVRDFPKQFLQTDDGDRKQTL